MSELLTTKQLQELLQVDRITVYRMLNDGRLKGVKVGNQWRFSQNEIDRLLGEEKTAPEPVEIDASIADFPVDCAQRVQEIFAGIIGIGAVTVTMQGEPITQATHCNPFCKLILENPSGRQACQESWRRIALRSTGQPTFQICHAGLSYMRSPIQSKDRQNAWMVAGQFYITRPTDEEIEQRLKHLAFNLNLPLSKLAEAADKVPVLRANQLSQVQEWTPRVASTIESFICEREDLMNRLQRIAEISTVRPVVTK